MTEYKVHLLAQVKCECLKNIPVYQGFHATFQTFAVFQLLPWFLEHKYHSDLGVYLSLSH